MFGVKSTAKLNYFDLKSDSQIHPPQCTRLLSSLFSKILKLICKKIKIPDFLQNKLQFLINFYNLFYVLGGRISEDFEFPEIGGLVSKVNRNV